MPIDVAGLAQIGAATLVAAMTTDLWQQARSRIVGLWQPGENADTVAAELDAARRRLGPAADGTSRHDAQVELATMFRLWLSGDHDLANRFESLVRELQAQVAQPAPAAPQHVTADHGSLAIAAGRDATVGSWRPSGASRPRWFGRRGR